MSRHRMLEKGETLEDLMERFPRSGQVRWIGVRPRRGGDVQVVHSATLVEERGLERDHRAEKIGTKRQVTLIQWEHLSVVAELCGREALDPSLPRRNIAVMGINISALKASRFRIGGAVLEGTGYCHPCSRMELNLGPSGYNAVSGHGGITARVIEGGTFKCGDEVKAPISG
jgi:MOSC domain-containing protein YiiM